MTVDRRSTADVASSHLRPVVGDDPVGDEGGTVDVGRATAFVVLGLLVTAFVVVGGLQAARDAPTVDEAPDVAAGVVAVEERDLRLNPEHGVIHHVVPGLAASVFADPVVPSTPSFEAGDWFDYTADFVRANEDAGRLDDVLFWFRLVPLSAAAAAGIAVYALAARLGGRAGGLVAAGLWLTTPYVVGLAHLSSLDISFAAVLVALALALVRDREAPTNSTAAIVAAVVGVCLGVRQSAVLLVPVAIVLLAVHRRPDRSASVRAVAIGVLVPLLVVWASYRAVDPSPVGGAPGERFAGLVSAASAQGPLERLVLAAPMPTEWDAGFAYLAITSDARPAYLLGSEWNGGRLWFFPVSAALKLPLSASLAVVGGAFVAVLRRRRGDAEVWVPVGALLAVVGLFTVVQPLNLGLRLFVPVLTLAFVAAGALGRLRPTVLALVGGTLAVAQVAAMTASHPHSLAWTPPPFSDGYRFVSDSTVDFGQAVFELRDEHRDDPFAAVSMVTPRGIVPVEGVPDVVDVDEEELVGRVAVGATSLTVVDRDELRWLWPYCPVEVIAESVLVYEFESPPSRTREVDRPSAPCDGPVSRIG